MTKAARLRAIRENQAIQEKLSRARFSKATLDKIHANHLRDLVTLGNGRKSFIPWGQ